MFQKKKRKTKKSPRELAKDKAWKACSIYIRTRGCIETTGGIEYGVCVTCGTMKPFGELDAGHYVSGRKDSILFVDDAINIQCRSCNRFQEGRKDEYETYMLNKYGAEKCEKFKLMKFMKRSLSYIELVALKQDYEEKTKILRGKL